MDEIVTRLHRAIVEAVVRTGRPDGPVKVADLYRRIVPYAAVRDRLDIALNADYEHALLRLLAGERGLLRLEPESAREELEAEVEAPYPFVGLFRKFSESDVWIELPPGASTGSSPATEPDPNAGPGPDPPEPAPPPPEPMEAEDRAEDEAEADGPCAFCGEPAPAGRQVRFCPRCGADRRLRPCSQCGARLERDWRYCIRCGHPAGG